MHAVVYVLCALASLFCAGLLARSYRRSGTRLLLWSTLCFVGLAVNNALLVIDLIAVPDVDLSLLRDASAFVALFVLLAGLIWEGAIVTLHILLSGANAGMSAIAGVFFLRYAALTRDRFFVLWALAFWMLAMNWAVIGTVESTAAGRHYAYLIRLAGFVVIAVAIIDKNRDRPR